jgi:hypothetical protein
MYNNYPGLIEVGVHDSPKSGYIDIITDVLDAPKGKETRSRSFAK